MKILTVLTYHRNIQEGDEGGRPYFQELNRSELTESLPNEFGQGS